MSEVGTPGSLGSAGVVNPVNTYHADSAWTNPAGMTGLEQNELMLGSQAIVPQRKFDVSSSSTAGGGSGGTSDEIAVVPSIFYAHKLNEKVTAGFSVVGAMGGGDKFDDDWAGRYGATEVALQGLAISPSVGYEVNDDLSLGAGVSFVYTMFYMEAAVNKPTPGDGNAEFDDLDDWGYQPFIGLTYQINERTLLGFVYRGEMEVELEGDLNLKNLPVQGSDAKLEWDNPQTLEMGIRYDLTDKWTMALNLGWQEWSTFSENTITVATGGGDQEVVINRGWDDTWHAGIAFSHIDKEAGRAFSFGFAYESSPVSDSNRTIDFAMDEQFKFSGAYGWTLNDDWKCSAGLTASFMGDAPVSQETQGEHFEGDFSTNIIMFGGFTAQRRF
jgi:long-chain fatty acid transport protein